MGILVLAAGSSHRFGSDKRTATLPSGQEMLRQTLSNASESDFPVTLVLGPRDIELATSLKKEFPDSEIIRSPESPLGIGYTLSFGIDHIRDLNWRICLIAHGDMPWVSSRLFNTIGKRVTPDNIVVPRYQERIGRPIGFGKNYFGELSDLRGDTDDSSVWHHHSDRVEYLELDDRGILDEINEPGDLLKHL